MPGVVYIPGVNAASQLAFSSAMTVSQSTS